MIKSGCRLSLTCEPLATIFILTKMRRKELQSDLALELRILSQIDFAHPSSTYFGDDLVMRDYGTGR
jgi:hypothetical protein